VIALALCMGAGFAAWRVLGESGSRDGAREILADLERRVRRTLDANLAGTDDAGAELVAPSGEAEAEPPTFEGELTYRTLDQALAEGDVAGALEIAVENDPDALRARLADGTFDPNLRLPGSAGSFTLPLEKAVRQGAPGTVEILLAAGADPNGRDSSLGSALASAASEGNVELVRRLLEAGADPELAGDAGFLPIEGAAYQGHLEVVRTLLAGGSGLHDALQSAGASGNLELVRLLLDAGADPRSRTRFDESSLRGAAREGHLEIVRVLLEAGARPCELAQREAAQNGRVDVLRAFGAAGARFDTPPAQFDPLYTAAYHGQIEAVRVLLELGASPSGYDVVKPLYADYPATAVGAARAQGHGDVAALLEAMGAR
jgi:ankyrin repeat protein